MGYYDFNDHFWSPQEVCAKLPRQQPARKLAGFWQLIEIFNFQKVFVNKNHKA
ncbi:MAG: hypothetical protein N4J56_007068 [Chroococcidiopsis sp. SAG 2025]|nr:hypothetical protein [Chroococcidiopsis sp. SAG 2025]